MSQVRGRALRIDPADPPLEERGGGGESSSIPFTGTATERRRSDTNVSPSTLDLEVNQLGRSCDFRAFS